MRVEVLMTDGAKHVFERVRKIQEGSGHTIEFELYDRPIDPIRLPREYIVGISIDV